MIVYLLYDEEIFFIKILVNLLEDLVDLLEDEMMLGLNLKVIGWFYLFCYEGEDVKEIIFVFG